MSPKTSAISDPIPLFGPEMINDPYPVYDRLRAADAIHWSEKFNAWILTRYDDVVMGLNDLRLASNRFALFQELAGSDDLKPLFSFLGQRLSGTDPPQHTRLRALLNKAFTPRVVEAMRPHIQQVVDRLLDAVQSAGQMDMVRDLAFPLPATIIAEMLGLPLNDLDQMKKWSDDFIVFFSTHPAMIGQDQWRRALHSTREMCEYFRTILRQMRNAPQQACLLQMMASAEDQGDKLSEEELFANANLLLVAGHETTTNVIGNGMYSLLRWPQQMAKLKADPWLIPAAVDELIRYDGPFHFTHRLALEDVTLGGKTIRRGQFVFLFVAAANHDPEHFANPDQLDVTRATHKQLGFGLGHHFCLGAPLARLEAQIAFATILRRLPNLRLAADKVKWRENFNPRGLQSLPVVFDNS